MRNVHLLLFFALLFLGPHSAAQQRYPLSRQDSADIQTNDSLASRFKAQGYPKEQSRHLNRMSMIYWEHNHFEEAVKYYGQSLAINKKLGNENGIAMINSNLAMIYADMGKYEKSVEYFEYTLTARRARGEKFATISALINLSVVLNNLGRYDESIKHLEDALSLARERNDKKQMRSCYGMLAETYEKAGNSDKSMYYFDYYRTFHEMVQDEKVKKSRQELENERLKSQLLEAEKRNQELALYKQEQELQRKDEQIGDFFSSTLELQDSLSEKEIRVNYLEQQRKIEQLEAEREKQRARTRLIVAIILILFFLALTGVFLYAYRQKRRDNKRLALQNQEIQEQQEEIFQQKEHIQQAYDEISNQNKQITSSIQYASMIQNAMLNRKIKLEELLPGSFILFRPRDVVSGDFHWYHKVDGKLIIAALDCTGHGVPGAFMSMIGNNLMDQIVKNEHITAPEKILQRLDDGIAFALNQESTGNEDGMDAAVVTVDIQENILYFGGAKRPLLIFKDGKWQKLKGIRKGIGGKKWKTKKQEAFTNEKVTIDSPLQIYIFSDGYIDQFGGEKGRKLMLKGLQEILENVRALPPQDQKKRLDEAFDQWRGPKAQLDDVLLIGAHVAPYGQKAKQSQSETAQHQNQ